MGTTTELERVVGRCEAAVGGDICDWSQIRSGDVIALCAAAKRVAALERQRDRAREALKLLARPMGDASGEPAIYHLDRFVRELHASGTAPNLWTDTTGPVLEAIRAALADTGEEGR